MAQACCLSFAPAGTGRKFRLPLTARFWIGLKKPLSQILVLSLEEEKHEKATDEYETRVLEASCRIYGGRRPRRLRTPTRRSGRDPGARRHHCANQPHPLLQSKKLRQAFPGINASSWRTQPGLSYPPMTSTAGAAAPIPIQPACSSSPWMLCGTSTPTRASMAYGIMPWRPKSRSTMPTSPR